MAYEISLEDAAGVPVRLTRAEDGATVWIEGRAHRCSLDGRKLTVDARTELVWVATDHDRVYVHAFGRAWELTVVDPVESALARADTTDVASAPMPGTVVRVAVKAGENVTAGQLMIVMESMKMHSEIVAWREGTVERVHVELGDSFDRGAALVGLAAVDQE